MKDETQWVTSRDELAHGSKETGQGCCKDLNRLGSVSVEESYFSIIYYKQMSRALSIGMTAVAVQMAFLLRAW